MFIQVNLDDLWIRNTEYGEAIQFNSKMAYNEDFIEECKRKGVRYFINNNRKLDPIKAIERRKDAFKNDTFNDGFKLFKNGEFVD